MKKKKFVLWSLSVVQVLLLLLIGITNLKSEIKIIFLIMHMLVFPISGFFSAEVYLGTYQVTGSNNSFCVVRSATGFILPMIPFSALTGIGYKHRLIKNAPCPNDELFMIYDSEFMNSSGFNSVEITRAECRKILKNPAYAKKYFAGEPQLNHQAFLSDSEAFISSGLVKRLYSSIYFSVLEFPNSLCGIFMYKKMYDHQCGFYVNRQVVEKIIADPRSFLKEISGMSREDAEQGSVVLDKNLFVALCNQRQIKNPFSERDTPAAEDNRKVITSQMIREKSQSDVKASAGTRISVLFLGLMAISGIVIAAASNSPWSLFFSAVFLAGLIGVLFENKKEKAKRREALSHAHITIKEDVCTGKRYEPHTESADSYYVRFDDGREVDNCNLYQAAAIGTVFYTVICFDGKITQCYFYNKAYWKLAQELEPFVIKREIKN